MDYEKLHKDTIAKLQEMVNSGKITVETACGICADFVPESEDERIRKSLIGHLKECRNNTRSEVMLGEYAKWIAWLEKQADQKLVDVRTTGYWHVEDVEQKPADTEKGAKGNKREIPFTAWSEEDERMKNQLVDFMLSGIDISKAPYGCVAWLKSLKDRVQPQTKYEWSDYDEKIRSSIIDFIRYELNHHAYIGMSGVNSALQIEWLKSLRPPTTWKPSDEQMDALYTYIYNPQYFSSPDPRMELVESVYKDLKKLKEK